jgi:hypothetical protein
MREIALYPTVKGFLEAAGFEVKGEVCGCDIVAVRDEERSRLAIVEMKLGFSLDLLLQAVDRMSAADEVWLAVPATRRGHDRDPRVRRLCRLLGLGMMAVDTASDRIEVLAEPGPYRLRSDQRRRSRLLSEHRHRQGDPSPGGSTRQPVMTAYRQRALACAAMLRAGPCRPRDLRVAASDAGRILLRNVYGWFERPAPGMYRLTGLGEAALQRWAATTGEPETDTQRQTGRSGRVEAEPRSACEVLSLYAIIRFLLYHRASLQQKRHLRPRSSTSRLRRLPWLPWLARELGDTFPAEGSEHRLASDGRQSLFKLCKDSPGQPWLGRARPP